MFFCSRENRDSNYKVQDGSFFNNSIQETAGNCEDSVPQTFNSDLTSDSTFLPGRHCSAKEAMPSLPEGANGVQLATKFIEMAGNAADSSAILPGNCATAKKNDYVNRHESKNLVQNQKTDECLVEVKHFPNPNVPVFGVMDQATTPSDKVQTRMQNEGADKSDGQEGASAVGGANKLRESMPRPYLNRTSLPASLTNGSIINKLGKGLDSSIPRGPSPLSVLTDRPANESAKDGGSSQNLPTAQSEVPFLSIRRFRPITVQDYFTVSSSNSLNSVGHETSEKVTNDKQVDTSRVMKDANHNVVMTTAVSAGDRDALQPISELAGFLSPRYVPSRPLSQICSRTMGNSLRRKIGFDDGDSTSLTSVESLPTVDSSGNTPVKPNVSAQIRFARSCSRIGLKSPMPSEGFPEQGNSTPRLPVAGSLPSFDLYHSCSGGTLTPQTPFSVYSRGTDSSRQSQCSTPVVGDCPSSPCTTPTMSSGFQPGALVLSRNTAGRLSRHQALDEERRSIFISLFSGMCCSIGFVW